ncbi:MAG TPA: carbon-nitrogen family hydrolase [Candidatus Eisenbacteria bacterium]|jgi:predicted amidohydrolase|nr:carbon-nitrogen family hydrolase [Candidatus Eisenbacteria bacterium]
MKIYCCQFDIAWENKPANCAKVRSLLADTKPLPGSLVLLPEMFATGFSMNVSGIAEGKSSPTAEFLAQTAREFGVFLLGGLVTKSTDGRGLNQAVAFSPDGKELARYNKIQTFTLGGETANYAAGNEIVTFTWQNIVVAPFICYDLRFPELFRLAARRGPELFTVIAEWPVMRIHHWVALLQARAIENQAYVAGVNRCGRDPKLIYNGRTLIVSPRGEILVDAGDGERVISAELNLDDLRTYRKEFPALPDMRQDYETLLR